MSKKPKRSRHRVPSAALAMRSDPIDDRYQAEVDASTARLEARYRKAQKALEAAERRAERARAEAQRLADKKAEADRIAANRLAEEKRLGEYIAQIREAAQRSRVAAARADLERKRAEAVQRRNAARAARKTETKAAREREHLIARNRASIAALESDIAEHRRELREIERLMMPGNYAGRDHRGVGSVRQTHGGAA